MKAFKVGNKPNERINLASDLRGFEPAFDKQTVELIGLASVGSGSGLFWYDAADTTTADDAEDTIVTAGGKRWKRLLQSEKYDVVADAIADTTLRVGQVIETSGYNSVDDGGGNKYQVVAGSTGTDDGGSYIDTDNGLQLKGLFPGRLVRVEHFGVSGDLKTVDQSSKVQAAIDYKYNSGAGLFGGDVHITSKTSARIAFDITVKPNIRLRGPHFYLDTTDRDIWPNLGGSLLIDSTATIRVKNGAGVISLLLYRYGMTFPAGGLTTTEVALYAGTAITVESAAPYIGYSTILGFERAIDTDVVNTPRGRIEYVNIDCTNGVRVDLDLGAWTLQSVKCQPILSNSDADNIRSGIGIDIKNKSDWTTLIDCFVFQDTGYKITDSNQLKFIGCGADHPTDGTDTYLTGKGFEVIGNSTDNFFTACQSASHEKGFSINTNAGNRTTLTDCHAWNMNSATGLGVELLGGDASVNGGLIGSFRASGGKAVLVNDASSKITLSGGLTIENVATGVDSVAYSECIVDDSVTFNNVTNVRTNEAIKQIASSGTISLPNNETIFDVTGTTTIGTLVGATVTPHKVITLIISNGLTINHGNFLLSGSVNAVLTAGSNITLQYITGNTWREIGRMTA